MKDFFNLRKSKLLLLTLLAVIVGASPAWAQKALPYSYGFEDADEMAKFIGKREPAPESSNEPQSYSKNRDNEQAYKELAKKLSEK